MEKQTILDALTQGEITSNQLITFFNPVIEQLDPLQRMRLAAAFVDAAKEVSDNNKESALSFTADEYPTFFANHTEFVHKGYTYSVTEKREFNFSQKGDYTEDEVKEWRELKRKIDANNAANTTYLKRQNSCRNMILLNHPRMQPTKVTLSVVVKR